ncbi:OmpW family protein [Luteimonas yindakuii]|uniref:OmpW family protein n=1 Tax=Luteimonas yindakuii TaxID=2565782 RepID=A0A4Z1RB15_9GAMM|nr:OmpW family outer membrane protein [Luteimonas yindakuii]TKS53353.1 OmpW family protein [Luteimonas yindakuii]
MRLISSSLLALALAAAAVPAAAQSAGDWTVAVGAHNVDPKSDNGTLAAGTLPVSVDSNVRPTIALEYFVRDALGIEVLAALPFQHDIAIAGLGTVATTKHLPPTVSLQYHFNNGGKVSPLLGLGVNYTTFFSEDTRGALAGADLELGDSRGLAAHAGVDIRLGNGGALRIDARWIDIDSSVRLDGAKLGTASIDPWVYGAAYVHRF